MLEHAVDIPALPVRLTGDDLRDALRRFALDPAAERKAAAITARIASGWRDPGFFERRDGLDRRIEEATR